LDLAYGPEYERFRAEVRSFIAEHWPEDRAADPTDDDVRTFRRRAVEAGLLYRSVPTRYGGSGQEPDALKAQVIREELARCRAPGELVGLGPEMLVPTLLEWGTDWQKERFVRPTLEGTLEWCQGYSEPGAGSDLASLRTSAVLDGDEWVINGQKVWTTGGHVANMMFALVRTEPDAPKRRSLSYLLLEMDQPGIEVRPLKQITGTAEFNEVFFTDARTPADWIVGGRGEGWAVANTTLKHERVMIGNVSRSDALFSRLVALAHSVDLDGSAAITDPGVQARLVEIEGWLEAQRYSGYVQTTRALRNEPIGPLGLMNKLANTNIGHRVAALALDLIGDDALLPPTGGRPGERPGPERWMMQYFGSLGLAIAGGTSNIQRNIIAERALGLPRDPYMSDAAR